MLSLMILPQAAQRSNVITPPYSLTRPASHEPGQPGAERRSQPPLLSRGPASCGGYPLKTRNSPKNPEFP